MRNIKLTIEYDGTNYHGWQVQPNGVTIQAVIQTALTTLTKAETQIVGAGRTDTGVHAAGQVANFHTNSQMPERWKEEKSLFPTNALQILLAWEILI